MVVKTTLPMPLHLRNIIRSGPIVGLYRRTRDVRRWPTGLYFLPGVESAFYLWINGYQVGYSEDSYTPADFNITPYLHEGENSVSVQVYRWSDGSYMEDQDFIRLSGIFRDVYLYSKG